MQPDLFGYLKDLIKSLTLRWHEVEINYGNEIL